MIGLYKTEFKVEVANVNIFFIKWKYYLEFFQSSSQYISSIIRLVFVI